MGVTYFKRYRMEIALNGIDPSDHPLPEGFRFAPWRPEYLQLHAKVKWECFRYELDATVFPCLGQKDGCHQLMRDISSRNSFVPEATWLILDVREGQEIAVATVQGLRPEPFQGAIQNLGVLSRYRGLGLGTSLLFKALDGFASVGCQMAHLEVTVQNTAAVRLYQRLGFRRVETVFKVADVAMA